METPDSDGEVVANDLVELRSSGRSALVAAVVIGVLVALLVGILATGDSSGQRQTRSPLLGRIAPRIEGTTLAGATFDLDALRGRWVVVNFFATWCTPCIVEHPELTAFDEEHDAKNDAEVVSVLYGDDPDAAREFFAERGGDWPVVVDADGSIGVAYGVAGVPESFLVAPNGIVVQRIVGGVTAAQLNEVLAGATREAVPD